MEHPEERDTQPISKAGRLVGLVWGSLIALMFGYAGLGLMLNSPESSDAYVGMFVLGLACLALYWTIRRYVKSVRSEEADQAKL